MIFIQLFGIGEITNLSRLSIYRCKSSCRFLIPKSRPVRSAGRSILIPSCVQDRAGINPAPTASSHGSCVGEGFTPSRSTRFERNSVSVSVRTAPSVFFFLQASFDLLSFTSEPHFFAALLWTLITDPAANGSTSITRFFVFTPSDSGRGRLAQHF
jgi:hypothetical protein